ALEPAIALDVERVARRSRTARRADARPDGCRSPLAVRRAERGRRVRSRPRALRHVAARRAPFVAPSMSRADYHLARELRSSSVPHFERSRSTLVATLLGVTAPPAALAAAMVGLWGIA